MNYRKLNKRREFSEQLKRQAVADFRSGNHTALELADLYHCHHQTIYNWIYKYSPGDSPQVNVVEMSESTDKKVKDLHDKIAQLERALGQKQIKVDFLEKMIDLAEEKKFFFEAIEWFRENRQMTDYSLNSLYKVAGISKQGVWDHFRREKAELEMIERVI